MHVIRTKLLSINKISSDIIEVALYLDGAEFDFKPGQYFRLTIPKLKYPDTKNFRDFSIASSANNRRELRFLMRPSESGFKRSLLEMPEGSEIKVTGPFGNMLFPDTENHTLILVAGGIGITPFLSMLLYAVDYALPFHIHLIWGAGSEEEKLAMDAKISTFWINPLFHYQCILGRIPSEFIESTARKHAGALWYIAGPPGMVVDTGRVLSGVGISSSVIRREEFLGYEEKKLSKYSLR